MKEHMKNGLAVAHFLENHKQVEKVVHPGEACTNEKVGCKIPAFGLFAMITSKLTLVVRCMSVTLTQAQVC
jgi:cystathionine gamma-lyase